MEPSTWAWARQRKKLSQDRQTVMVMALPMDGPERLCDDGTMTSVEVETTAADVAMVREGGEKEKNGSWLCYQVKQNEMNRTPQSGGLPFYL
jgi:hypothetical protein